MPAAPGGVGELVALCSGSRIQIEYDLHSLHAVGGSGTEGLVSVLPPYKDL